MILLCKIDIAEEILKSNVDRSKLVPRHIIDINGHPKTVYINPFKGKRKTKYQNTEFEENNESRGNKEIRNKLISELENKNLKNVSKNEVSKTVRQLSELNALAYKGNRYITNTENEINKKIYKIKEDILQQVINRKSEFDIGYSDGIVYYRNSETGIQYSFHDFNGVFANTELPEKKWDGVRESFKYTPEQYKKALKLSNAIQSYNQKKDEIEMKLNLEINNQYSKAIKDEFGKILNKFNDVRYNKITPGIKYRSDLFNIINPKELWQISDDELDKLLTKINNKRYKLVKEGFFDKIKLSELRSREIEKLNNDEKFIYENKNEKTRGSNI